MRHAHSPPGISTGELQPGEVRLIVLDVGGAATLAGPALQQLEAILDSDERSRAARFVFAADRARYIMAHAALRRFLGQALSCPAQEIRFRTGRFGKPALANPPARGEQLFFNLSHSASTVLVGLATTDLGVDVEDIRDNLDPDSLAEQVFSPREQQALAARPPGRPRIEAFFALWTRKEALLKALGTGFFRKPTELDLGEDALVSESSTWHDPLTGTDWSLEEIAVGPQRKASVAVKTRSPGR
jgi:4'-phosphopantetheinyl transferase